MPRVSNAGRVVAGVGGKRTLSGHRALSAGTEFFGCRTANTGVLSVRSSTLHEIGPLARAGCELHVAFISRCKGVC